MTLLTDPVIKTVTTLANGDLIPNVDISDTSGTPAGTSAKITAGNLSTFIQSSLGNSAFQDIANDVEIFAKNAVKPISASGLFNNTFFQNYVVTNSIGSLAQVVAIGGTYNILTSLLAANEAQISNVAIAYKTIANAAQTKILDEVNNKFLFPSNLYTYGTTYTQYIVRVSITIDVPLIPNHLATRLYLRLRRVVDNSIVYTAEFNQSTFAAQTGVSQSHSMPIFVNDEADPFVVGGVYLDILNNAASATSITVQSVDISIFRN